MGFRNQAGTGQPNMFFFGRIFSPWQQKRSGGANNTKDSFSFFFLLNDPKSPDYGEKSF